MEVINQLLEIFHDVFEDEELSIDRSTTANDIEDWDSLMHVNLVLAIEKEFDIRFTSSEVAGLKNVGQLLDLIEDRL